MNKIKFISKTKESWERKGKFDPPFLEGEIMDEEVMFDIGRRDQIRDLKSECIFLSKEDAKRLGEWLLDIPTQE